MKKPLLCIIEDEPDLAETCANILTQAGYQVETCTDPALGLEKVNAEKFDLVLVDLMMPKISGTRILQEVKKANPACKVIIFTGYPTIESAVQAMKEGASEYLVKPFMAAQLVDLVAKTLGTAVPASVKS